MRRRVSFLKNLFLIINFTIFFFLIFIDRNQYIYNMTYFKCILFMIVNSIFIYTYGILLNEEKIYRSNLLIYIFSFIVLLISFTFFLGRTGLNFYTWCYTGQYKPFYTIISQLKYGSIPSLLKNVIGNIVMLVPFSFLLMIKNPKNKNILKQSIIILPTIITIEVLQTFTHTGAFDMDDIILNYFGVISFTFIITRWNLIDKIRKLFYTDFKLADKTKKILFYLSLAIMLANDIFILIK